MRLNTRYITPPEVQPVTLNSDHEEFFGFLHRPAFCGASHIDDVQEHAHFGMKAERVEGKCQKKVCLLEYVKSTFINKLCKQTHVCWSM